MIHHHLVSASYWLLQKAGSGGRGLSEQSQVVCWWVRGYFFYYVWEKEGIIKCQQWSDATRGRDAIFVTGSLPVRWSHWPCRQVIFSFWRPFPKEVGGSGVTVTPYRDKKVFMTKETKMDVMSN